jgi:hypothetical protein
MDGIGILSWEDGVEYVGQFQNDKFHGNGQYKWKDGKTYIGGWVQGMQHGDGKLIVQNKVKIGKWVNGERDGAWIHQYDESNGQSENDSCS